MPALLDESVQLVMLLYLQSEISMWDIVCTGTIGVPGASELGVHWDSAHFLGF